jgi:membrane protein required for colicin V production
MTTIDYIVLLVLILSCVVGFMRGLLREIISLATWVLAVTLAWRLSGIVEPYLGGALAGAAVRTWAARGLVFVCVLLIGTATGAIVSHFVRLSIFSSMDRMLGALFGAARGMVLLGVFAILAQSVKVNEVAWYKQSLLLPYAERVASLLRAFAGARLETVSSAVPVAWVSPHASVQSSLLPAES